MSEEDLGRPMPLKHTSRTSKEWKAPLVHVDIAGILND